MMRLTVGNIIAISRPPRSAVAVRSSLASSKRAVSSGSRTNARTTRMPGDLLAQHAVDVVDALLHALERRHHARRRSSRA